MKTQNQFTVKLAGLISTTMFVALLISMLACTSTTKKQDAASNTETSVKTPSVDIFAAAFMGNVNATNQHIAVGTDLNAKDQYGSTPLQIASTFGKTDVAIALINGGADLNSTSNDGSTPLHTAAFFCRTEIVEALLKKGADQSIKNSYGSTALESVQAPFDSVKAIYQQIGKDLGPLGLKLDYEFLETTRPKIAELLK
ncbi:ankyrin repeat domain-containing protein [Labilibaculum antarcticum]|uniref:Uncharacterized protein n=1 Tax=Labilibaculum antarcticum TaxID=1717717 RepID=A0A1Y1CQ76_9BACT|nr:ankyrin repeat domain-containing protein [Labilibaculum antarcticum]BAX82525.1 hypothetical protein ALGA_4234 [Labilibaculum antarcticum]